ncbi:unnamed protein product [Prorocentrum cordatum]|uniref:Uncharacterized protein n=1 Tax=Prorocentrum cordatum TaxID=2364126 RepID=A0ABN9T407_9DINO|nr:unnamed protein product [Polarella glacialis]
MAWAPGGLAYARIVGGVAGRQQGVNVGGYVVECHEQHVSLAVPALAVRAVGGAAYDAAVNDRNGAEVQVGFVIVLHRRLRQEPPEGWADDYMHFGDREFELEALQSGLDDSSSDSEAEPEARPVRGGAAAGAAAARSDRRRQLSSSDEEAAFRRAAQPGASSSGLGGPAAPGAAEAAAKLDANGLQSLLQLRLLEVLERLETGKRGSSSGDESETVGGLGSVGKAGKAVRGMRRLRLRVRRYPLRVVKVFRGEVKQAFRVQHGMAWTYLDYEKRHIPWGKLYDLKKTYAMLVAVLEYMDQGLFDEAHGQLVQIMKALQQVAINHSRKTEVVAAYIAELEALESKIKQHGGAVASPEKSDNGQGADIGAGARTTGAKSTNKKKNKPKKEAA